MRVNIIFLVLTIYFFSMGKFYKFGLMMCSLLFLYQGYSFAVETAAVKASDAESATYANLYAAVQGETNASAAYKAFAEIADEEGFPVIARLFRATADAEAKHAADEWAVLQNMGATERPEAETPTVGTTAENLLAAFEGETYEYTVMYPDFLQTAKDEGYTDAERIFNRAMKAEEVHAGNFDDVLTNLEDKDYLNATYETVFRCPVCGEVVTVLPDNRCPICGASAGSFVSYNLITGTEFIPQAKELYAYVQDGRLIVDGLTPGNQWRIYAISGQLVYMGTAAGSQAVVNLPTRGVYLVATGNAVIKIIF